MKLCDADGVSGYEDEIRAIMKSELSKCGDTEIDLFGNVICKMGSGAPKVMLAAHMDEIGLLVKHIDEKGFIRFIDMGGVDDDTLPASRVKIMTETGPIPAIIGFKPPHLKDAEELKKKLALKEMYIDTGLPAEDVKKKVQIGDAVLFESKSEAVGDMVIAKALDNRAGCAALIEAMKALKNSGFKGTVYGVGTAQEEIGLKGARTSAHTIAPDFALAIDTGIAGDVPDINSATETDLTVGKGPAITVVESSGRGLVPCPLVKKHLLRCARDAKIDYQLEATKGGMTDAAIIYMSNGGVRTGGISIPTRYIHSPNSLASVKDVENAAKLVVEFVKRITEIY